MRTTQEDGAAGSGARCPVCERYVGTAGRCPYCDEAVPRDPWLRGLRLAALGLGGVGLVFLYLSVRGGEIPRLRIGALVPPMDCARVRVAGTVMRRPYVARGNGAVEYLSFLVDDGSGALRVAARGRAAQALAAEARIPEKGARVDVSGSLRVSANGAARLYLDRAEDLRP
ncbi:MAG: hypothetical protein JW951_10050 [Lentisphaerae bacterium]|nr:hypothetical protein [Lentisphaerota bacterium]